MARRRPQPGETFRKPRQTGVGTTRSFLRETCHGNGASYPTDNRGPRHPSGWNDTKDRAAPSYRCWSGKCVQALSAFVKTSRRGSSRSALASPIASTASWPGFTKSPRVDGQDGSDSLSIQSSRGLALLGLAERATILVQLENGTEELFVEDVLSQPEAEEKAHENSRGLVQADSSGRTSNVVSFQRKRAPMTFANHLPEDDDPGPSAA